LLRALAPSLTHPHPFFPPPHPPPPSATRSDGAIKVEVSGGGVNANYSVSSGVNRAEVEIDGERAPLRGYLGSAAAGSGKNSILLRSEKDAVQLSLLPSPL